MRTQIESMSWQDAVPQIAQARHEGAAFATEAIGIITDFEGRFRPGEPTLISSGGEEVTRMTAGIVDENPIQVSAAGKRVFIDAVLPWAGVSMGSYRGGSSSDFLRLPTTFTASRAVDSEPALPILNDGFGLDTLKKNADARNTAVGAEEIIALIEKQELPIKELAALIALKAVGIEIGCELGDETRSIATKHLIKEISKAALHLGTIENVLAANKVIKAERDELEPHVSQVAETLAAQYGNTVGSAGADVDNRLGLILDRVFSDGPVATPESD